MKKLLLILTVLLLIPIVIPAKIEGNVYDLSLNEIKNTIVTINTIPEQKFVIKNGSYSFNVPIGVYIIKANQMDKNMIIASTNENISIKDDGLYKLDLLLFPDLNAEDEIINETNLDITDEYFNETNYLGIILIILTIGLIILAYILFKKTKKLKIKEIEDVKELKKSIQDREKQYDTSEDLKPIIKALKENNGRLNQKELRKIIPLSEAKISLMIAELESKGIIQKIKKGRGNIIILK